MSRVVFWCIVALHLVAALVRAQAPSVPVASGVFGVSGNWCQGRSQGRLMVSYAETSGVKVTSSIDSGETWSAPAVLASQGAQPVMAVLGQRVAIAYLSTSVGNASVFLVLSSDGGSTWSSPVQVNSGPLVVRASVRCAITSSGVFVIWHESGAVLKFNRLLFSTGTFLSSDVGVASTVAGNPFPSISAVDYSVFPQVSSAVFVTQNGSATVAGAFAVCTDAGAVTPVFTTVVVAPALSTFVDGRVVLGAGGAPEYYAVWRVPIAGVPTTRVASAIATPSSPGGWAVTTLSTGAAPSMAVHSGAGLNPRLVVATTIGSRIWVSSGSVSGGALVMTSGVPVSAAPSSSFSASTPRLSIDGSVAWCSWRNTSGSANQVYVSRSRDFGVTWLLPSEALLCGLPVGGGVTTQDGNLDMNVVAIESLPGVYRQGAYVFWCQSTAVQGIRVTRVMGTAPYGSSTGVTGLSVVPGGATGPALPGATVDLIASMASGGVASYAAFWLFGFDRGPISMGLLDPNCGTVNAWIGGGTIIILGAVVNPSPSVLTVPIPASGAFLGTRFNATIVAINGGVVGCPWDTANGVETYIY